MVVPDVAVGLIGALPVNVRHRNFPATKIPNSSLPRMPAVRVRAAAETDVVNVAKEKWIFHVGRGL
jgi:hypothetical protein